MYIFDLAKVKISSRKLNYYYYKKKKNAKSSFGVCFLNKVLKKTFIIYKTPIKKRIIPIKPNFVYFSILIDRLWHDKNKYQAFLQENNDLLITESSTESTIYRKNTASVLLRNLNLKNSFSLLRLKPGVDEKFLINFDFLAKIFDFNFKNSRFFKVFTPKIFLSKEACQKFQNLLLKTSLSKIYFQTISLIEFINIFKVVIIFEKFFKN